MARPASLRSNPVYNPSKERNLSEFIAHIGRDYHNRTNVDLAELARAVFETVNSRMSEGQAAQVRDMLNEDLRELWPAPEAVAS